MIYTIIPFAPREHHKELAWLYNRYLDIVPEGEWVCFIDHDAMWTTLTWNIQLEEIIEKNPEYSCFTAVTNRTHNGAQRLKTDGSHDMRYHRKIGLKLQQSKRTDVVDVTDGEFFSGTVILLKNDGIKFRGNGVRGVDNNLHRDIVSSGKKIGVMSGIYVYHWYRYFKLDAGKKWFQENYPEWT